MIFQQFEALIQQIGARPLASLGVVVNLIIIESLLSVDNAAVLATMVLDLPKDQRRKALRYGILGAYFFRGVCLLFASALITIWWFKPLGGLYLLFLALHYFLTPKKDPATASVLVDIPEKKRSWIYRKTRGALGNFWSTVLMVEIMDIAFSIDNVIAANAYSKNIILIWLGVFIGILTMRFVSQGFVGLMEKYPFLQNCAFLVIGMLGLKLTLAGYTHFNPCSALAVFMEGKNECLLHHGKEIPAGEHPLIWGDIITSALSMAIFFVPILTSWLFNFPKHQRHNKKVAG